MSRRRYIDSRRRRTFLGVDIGSIHECEHCDGERSPLVREDYLRGHICPPCDSSLDEMFGEGSYARKGVAAMSRRREEGGATASPAVLCANCESSAHARCCSRCGKVHKPARLHHEHCSAKCDRDAAQADRLSAAMEERP